MPVRSSPLPAADRVRPVKVTGAALGLSTFTCNTTTPPVPGGWMEWGGEFVPTDTASVGGVGVFVTVAVGLKVLVAVSVGVWLGVAVGWPVSVTVGLGVGVEVRLGVGVAVAVGVAVGVAVNVRVGVGV
jgi:hypothetical protein